MSKIANGERPSLPPGMPASLAKIVADCWAQDPGARPSMVDAVADLGALMEAHKGDATARCGDLDAAAAAAAAPAVAAVV